MMRDMTIVGTVAVAVAAHLPDGHSVLHYSVPSHIADIQPGHLVSVPLRRRFTTGVIMRIELPPPGIALRSIHRLIDPLPVLTAEGVALLEWMALFYGEPLADVLRTIIPSTLISAPSTGWRLAETNTGTKNALSDVQRRIIAALTERGDTPPPESLIAVELNIKISTLTRSLRSLQDQGMVEKVPLQTSTWKDKEERVVTLHHTPRPRLTPKQTAIVDYLEQNGGTATEATLRANITNPSPTLAVLAQKQVVTIATQAVRRDPLAHRVIVRSAAPQLTPAQQASTQAIRSAIEQSTYRPFLLHGVTGSGKTEVYLHAIAHALAMGKTAMYLVPEISLTPQTIDRIAARFPGQVGVLHSALGSGERHDEWQRLRRGDAHIVVGARSAVFAPVPNLGVIVLDEEHDGAYKQDNGVRYHARDIALHLGSLSHAPVVMGSATPDVGSFYRARQGTYTLLELPARVRQATAAHGDHGLPDVRIIDMRQELRAGNTSVFSRALTEAIEQSLSRGEQAIVLLNRRGSATFVNCRDCGTVVRCQACDLPFTFHSTTQELVCHRCNARRPSPTLCERCGSWRIRYFGLGTQKLEEATAAAFPAARILRWDRDVATGKHGHEHLLDRFANRQADILIGTQMIAKGLDIPLVTTVGVISADTSLYLPDFRAPERTFQLLTQVAGRAGRADRTGHVVIQTYSPDHYAVDAAARHDYAGFYRDELLFRTSALYPPVTRLLRLIGMDRNPAVVSERAERTAAMLRDVIATLQLADTDVIGPAPCFMIKVNHMYRWHIIVRGAIPSLLPYVPEGWTHDVDPLTML